MEGRRGAEMFPLRLLGFGLYLAWEALIVPFERGWGVEGFSSSTTRLYVITTLTAALLLAAALRARARGGGRVGLRAVVAMGACATCSPLLELLGVAVGGAAGTGLDLAAIALRCVGDAGFFLAWNAELAGHRAPVAWVAYAGSFALAACVFYGVHGAGLAAITAAALVLPALNCLLLALSARLPREGAGAAGGAAPTWRLPWRPVALVAAFSFAYFLAAHYDGNIQSGSELGRLVVAVCVLVPLVACFDRAHVELLCRVSPALMVAGLLLCTFAEPTDALNVRGLLVSAAFNGFTMYVLLSLNSVCYRLGVASVWVFGVTQAVCLTVRIPATLLGTWLAGAGAADPTLVAGVMDGVAVAVVLLSTLLPADWKAAPTWGLTAARPEPADGEGQDASGPAVVSGKAYLEDHVYRCALVARRFGLTLREEEVLSLVSQGLGAPDVEAALCIAHGTLRVHLTHIYAKLGVHSREEVCALVRDWRP